MGFALLRQLLLSVFGLNLYKAKHRHFSKGHLLGVGIAISSQNNNNNNNDLIYRGEPVEHISNLPWVGSIHFYTIYRFNN